jgi:N-acetylated-alpha-linked acidic dipeptidase
MNCRLPAVLLFAIAVAPLGAQARPELSSIRGFAADALATQRSLEQRLRSVPSADSLRARMRLLSEEPHEAGTERSRQVAELILARFRSFGLDARIEQFEALMPRPVSRSLELLGPERFTASLSESVLSEDKDSGDREQLPTYNAYSKDGDVTGELVYVNYGIPADYKVLDSLGISVKGKIVIARYGRSWRGIKPKVAAEHGAIGCIIYSDPRDDGYFEGDVYPKGPMRPSQGVQRGSVMDMPVHPGDPLSPGWASEPGSRRLAMEQAKTFERIPVLPIGYGDALPLLRNLGGPVAPESWRGALPITYHVGGGPARVRLALQFEWKTRPLYNVIARIPGARTPDQWIVFGNHHDAWVNGAEDPISGMVALEETARAFGTLMKSGWRPSRTIIFAAWDGEEWGLLGSTEWAEKHQDELRAKAVAYLNSDTNDRGWLGVAGSHSLEAFMREVARDITDPQRKMSVLDASIERRRAQAAAPDTGAVRRDSTRTPADSVRADSVRRAMAQSPTTRAAADTSFTIGALGSGSDYTAFLDHLGLPSLNISYGGDGNDGIYHSIYDSFDFYRRFKDTTFLFGVAEAQTTGTTILRLSEAAVLPFEFTAVVRTYRKYVGEIEKAAKKNDTTRALVLTPVSEALDRLERAANRHSTVAARVSRMTTANLLAKRAVLDNANRELFLTERALTDTSGLPGRGWFRHLLYAPGFYTGYGVKTMPGIREAVEDRPNLAVARQEATRVAAAIDRYAARVNSATDLLESVVGK